MCSVYPCTKKGTRYDSSCLWGKELGIVNSSTNWEGSDYDEIFGSLPKSGALTLAPQDPSGPLRAYYVGTWGARVIQTPISSNPDYSIGRLRTPLRRLLEPLGRIPSRNSSIGPKCPARVGVPSIVSQGSRASKKEYLAQTMLIMPFIEIRSSQYINSGVCIYPLNRANPSRYPIEGIRQHEGPSRSRSLPHLVRPSAVKWDA